MVNSRYCKERLKIIQLLSVVSVNVACVAWRLTNVLRNLSTMQRVQKRKKYNLSGTNFKRRKQEQVKSETCLYAVHKLKTRYLISWSSG